MLEDIRPISDLRNNFASINKEINEKNRPIIFTKNGYAEMVLLPLGLYNDLIVQKGLRDVVLLSDQNSK
jgi:PHD/YefM family antitoxin component YafN of YafNO toxin-antitoxin module